MAHTYFYTVDGKEYDYNSSINQRIKGHFVDGEVNANVTDMMVDLINSDASDWNYDDFDNAFYRVSQCCYSEARQATEDDMEAIKEYMDDPELTPEDVEFDDLYVCESCGKVFHDSESWWEHKEVLQYFIVNPYFGEKLRDHGEMVMERYGGWIWGRQCFGQAILLDGVVDEIAYDMEILDGQRHSWADQV